VGSFEKAANAYKVAKAWSEAGEAFTQASDCHQNLGQLYDAAGKLKEVILSHVQIPSSFLHFFIINKLRLANASRK
jgi:hypothetical protein